MKRNIARLIALFGSASELGRVAGIHRTAVTRWSTEGYLIGDEIQLRILRSLANGYVTWNGDPLDINEIAMLMGVKRCPCCKKPINDEIRAVLEDHCEVEQVEAAE